MMSRRLLVKRYHSRRSPKSRSAAKVVDVIVRSVTRAKGASEQKQRWVVASCGKSIFAQVAQAHSLSLSLLLFECNKENKEDSRRSRNNSPSTGRDVTVIDLRQRRGSERARARADGNIYIMSDDIVRDIVVGGCWKQQRHVVTVL